MIFKNLIENSIRHNDPISKVSIDILKNEFSGNNKIAWVLVVLLGNVLGALLYFIIGRKQKLSATYN